MRKNEKSKTFTQEEKDTMAMKNDAIDRIGNLGNSTTTNFIDAVKRGNTNNCRKKQQLKQLKKQCRKQRSY